MSQINIALLGYGTVGKGVYETIHMYEDRFTAALGKPVKIVAVLVQDCQKHELPHDEILLTTNFDEILALPNVDVVFDAIVGIEPARTYLEQSIQKGCHIITANKQMFAHHGDELLALAERHQVSIGFEATVGGGIPIIQTLQKLLTINNVHRIQGILNGTSNYILTSMREHGLTFTGALSSAQEKGYAEADPTNDIEGYDAVYKACILSQLIFGEKPTEAQIVRQGITSITSDQIQLFQKLGLRFKHVATIEKQQKGVNCSVRPVLVDPTHPLFSVEFVQNALSIDADIVGNISLQGPGAGMFPTASAMIEDLIHVYSQVPIQQNKSVTQTSKENQSLNWAILTDKAHALQANLIVQGSVGNNISFVTGTEEQVNKLPFVAYPILGEFSVRKLQLLSV